MSGPFQPLDPDVDLAFSQKVEAIGVSEEALREPDAADASLCGVGVTARNEVGNAHGAEDGGKIPHRQRGIVPFPGFEPSRLIRFAMATLDRERLKALIAERSLNPRALSRLVGDNPYLVRDILAGKSRNPRSDTLSALADALDVPLGAILKGGSTDAAPPSRVAPVFLPVKYRVRAGAWVEMDAAAQMLPSSAQPVSPDSRYAQWPQWLEQVEGDSIDLLIKPGSFAHVVDAIEMGYAARDGDIVVVERRRDGGALRERTIKQVAIVDRRIELWPRSSNPQWQSPLIISAGVRPAEDIEVEIVGLVVGAYASFR